eukprot:TRINITY_DN1668_c0_g1_i12.p1 TRINITY_DN1668_c0_g1~~TRINITY_DN1668_c0_g1_i12.p1  ORF type:complete len:221 (-),score=9.51 TRINITY_DN1668_c0_g1_i12:484-1146(-)
MGVVWSSNYTLTVAERAEEKVFFTACEHGNLKLVEECLRNTPRLALAEDKLTANATGLHWASLYSLGDSIGVIDALLKAGAAVEAVDSDQRQTPLHLAAGNGRLDVPTRDDARLMRCTGGAGLARCRGRTTRYEQARRHACRQGAYHMPVDSCIAILPPPGRPFADVCMGPPGARRSPDSSDQRFRDGSAAAPPAIPSRASESGIHGQRTLAACASSWLL